MGALVDLAHRAAERNDQGLASAFYNQSALLASDLGRPDLARRMCHRHADAFLRMCPLPAASAIRGLEPLVNCVRLQIRAGHTDYGRRRLLDLYEAVGAGVGVAVEGITVPADLTRTVEDRQEVRAWLWRVLLTDGTRALTTAGRWREALAHVQQHRGVGTRMLDGRQVAVVAALTDDDTEQAARLLAGTAPGDPWEQAVTGCLTALCRRDAGRDVDASPAVVVNAYLSHDPDPGLTLFDIRLGLTALNAVASIEQPEGRRLVDALLHRTTETQDGYAARELLADHLFIAAVTDRQTQECKNLVRACGLDTGVIPEEHLDGLTAGLNSSEGVITRSLTARHRDLLLDG
ncbi:hypothetical protein GT354_26935 [Streptomyces sp. SID3343]|nr:hypothetical protein [Streptomyces sp. SID3343]